MAAAENPSDTTRRALDGVRVLDFTQMMLGPLAVQTLADLGADVIKVEKPGSGEWMRAMPVIGEFVGRDSAAFHAFNRNKRSIGVDLKSTQGRQALLDIAVHCDVVTENFRAGVMDRLGLGYEDFKAVKPDIVFASGSGWGQRSAQAKAKRPGQDLLVQAMTGVMMNTGRKSDPPTACGTPVADFAASQAMATGILAALIARDRHGVGQRVEVDLFSAVLAMQGQENFAVLNQGIELERSEAGIAACWNDAPYGAYETADGWLVIAMCPMEKLGPLIGDEEIAGMDSWAERDAIKRRIEARTKTRPTEDWMAVFQEADVWAAPVRTSAEVMAELRATKSDRLIEMDHPEAGRITAIASPVQLSEMPADIRFPPPRAGEHTQGVVSEILGMERYEALKSAGAFG